MKTLKVIIFYSIIVQLYCCKVNHCEVDKDFELTFKNNIQIITDQQNGKREILVSDYHNAQLFFGRITGKYAPGYVINTQWYKDKKSFKSDIDAWKKWYKKNKCNFTKAKVDSIMNSHK